LSEHSCCGATEFCAFAADLREWSKSGDEDKLKALALLLADVPNNFVFEQRAFVVDLLERAQAVSQSCLDTLTSALWGSATSGMRHGSPGKPFPEHEMRRNSAQDTLQIISSNSPAWRSMTA